MTKSADGSSRSRLLIVDDNDATRKMLQHALADPLFGHDTIGARTIREAEELLELQPFDAVIVDLGLPNGDGADLVQTIQTREPFLAVIVLTGRDKAEVAARDLTCPILHKPAALEEIAATIRSALVDVAQQRKIAEQIMDNAIRLRRARESFDGSCSGNIC